MSPQQTPPSAARRVLEIVVLAVVYAGLGRLGQLAAIPPGHVTAIWPPSGVALAAVLVLGTRVWPGILIGSLTVNLWAAWAEHHIPPVAAFLPAAASIATGATLEALLGFELLRRFASGNPRRAEFLRTGRGVIRFVALAAASCLVSATIGALALKVAGYPKWAGFQLTLSTWWLGDLSGILVVTPLLLTWTAGLPHRLGTGARKLEAFVFVASVLVAGIFSFWGRYPLAYLIVPVLVWAAFRFGHHGATAAIFLLSVVAIWATASGVGPYVGPEFSLNESLLLLQGFMTAIVLTTVVLAAVVREREEVAEELRRHRDRLEDEVKLRTVKAVESEERAVEASQAKSQFLANVSHELRTPLNAIIGYTEMLADELREHDQEELLPDLQKVDGAARHLLSLINEILDLSKIEAGKMELVNEPFDVEALVKDVSSTIEPLARKNRNLFEVRILGVVGTMVADATRVRQVLFNLLSNGCKFTEGGRVTLEVSRAGDRVVFRVSDTGIGLTQDQLSRLFQAFVQAEATTSRRYGGTGIGLAISRRLAKLMGGDIQVTSAIGKGTTFTFGLPRAGSREPGDQLS